MLTYAHLPELNFLRWMRDALTMSDGEFITEFQRLSKSDINDFYAMYRNENPRLITGSGNHF